MSETFASPSRARTGIVNESFPTAYGIEIAALSALPATQFARLRFAKVMFLANQESNACWSWKRKTRQFCKRQIHHAERRTALQSKTRRESALKTEQASAPLSASTRSRMINKAKLTLITAVLAAGFASPTLADCLESGAAESCGGGYGSSGQTGPGLHYYGVFPGYGTYPGSEENGGF